jgi:hypothetical protein
MPLPLGTPGPGQATVGVTVGDSSGIGFGLHEPPKMRKAMTKLGQVGDTAVDANPTMSYGMVNPPDTMPAPSDHEGPHPQGSFASDSSSSTTSSTHSSNTHPSSHHHHGAPRGTLSVKLISARGLAVSHSSYAQPQPYVVMQFEQNEFVSSPPRPVASPASVPFTTAHAQPMTPGNLTRSTSGLGVGTISRAFAEAVGRGKGKKDGYDGSGAMTPKAEEPAGGGSWLGKPGPGDPVWKEEVALWVSLNSVQMPR